MAICKKTKADTYQLVTLIKMVEAYEAQSTHSLTSLGNQEQLLSRIEALLHKHDGGVARRKSISAGVCMGP
ncbi:hypothetical protein ABWL43_09140 [Pseudomonas sp. HT11]|uniref:hypothetical protein n=1 Tax=Pseudomonas sp. HT11 TaxID=3230490 RepID=UPI00384DAB0A